MARRHRSRGPRKLVLFLSMMTFGLLSHKEGSAFVIYNMAKHGILADIPDIFGPAEVSPGASTACHWSKCRGDRYEKLTTWIHAVSTINIVSLPAGGALEIREDDTNWNWPSSSFLTPPVYIDVFAPIPDQPGMAKYESTWPYINKRGIGHRNVHFMATADPQYSHYEIWRTKDVPDKTIATMRSFLHGDMRGIIIAGDLTQRATDDNFGAYQRAIAGHARYFFDGFGNHDLEGTGVDDVVSDVRARQRVTPVNKFPTLYSWNWDDVHFVHLNEYPYQGSLPFLRLDLAVNVGSSNNPVVLIHHYGFEEFSKGWWKEEDRKNYFEVIQPYRVVAIFTGHLHNPGELLQCWEDSFLDGGRIPFFISGSANQQDGSGRGLFLEVTIKQDRLTVIRRYGDNGEVKQTVSIDLLNHIPFTKSCSSMVVNEPGFLAGDHVEPNYPNTTYDDPQRPHELVLNYSDYNIFGNTNFKTDVDKEPYYYKVFDGNKTGA